MRLQEFAKKNHNEVISNPFKEALALVEATDDDISHWAKGEVEAIHQLGVAIGSGDNRFAPKETETRKEAVTMLLSDSRPHCWCATDGT